MKFVCPECGATPGKHGKGGAGQCDYAKGDARGCVGFLCECEKDTEGKHGESYDDPCENANCYHCGWGGTFPVPTFDPKKLTGWAKTAWSEGWKPPSGWTPKKKGVK